MMASVGPLPAQTAAALMASVGLLPAQTAAAQCLCVSAVPLHPSAYLLGTTRSAHELVRGLGSGLCDFGSWQLG
jgi:hypothetical protein